MATVLSLLLAIFKAIPSLQALWDGLVSMYVESQIASMKAENRAAIQKALQDQDQRDLEKAIGSPNAGKEVPANGSEIVDSLPGVKP